MFYNVYNFGYFPRYCVASRDIQPCELILRSVTLPENVYQVAGIKIKFSRTDFCEGNLKNVLQLFALMFSFFL